MEIKKPKENDEIDSARNVSDSWMEFLFDGVMRLTHYDRLMQSGCNDLIEFIRISGFGDEANNVLTSARIKNLELFINDFKIFLHDVRKLLPQKEFDDMKNKIAMNEDLFNGNIKNKNGDVIKISRIIMVSQTTKKREIRLEAGFFFLIKELSKLRSQLVNNLSDILYAQVKRDDKRLK